MKKIVALFLILGVHSALACSCYSPKSMVVHSLAKMQNINESMITIRDYNETYNFIHVIPNIIKVSLSNDANYQCSQSCSLKGVRVEAQVEFQKSGELCTAGLIKPARFGNKIKLKELECVKM